MAVQSLSPVTVTATAAQVASSGLASRTVPRRITLKSATGNTNDILVGGPGSAAQHFALEPGDSLDIWVGGLDEVWVRTASGTATMTVLISEV
jgi:hypothetical protein